MKRKLTESQIKGLIIEGKINVEVNNLEEIVNSYNTKLEAFFKHLSSFTIASILSEEFTPDIFTEIKKTLTDVENKVSAKYGIIMSYGEELSDEEYDELNIVDYQNKSMHIVNSFENKLDIINTLIETFENLNDKFNTGGYNNISKSFYDNEGYF